MMKRLKLAALISGRGSNLKALINACRTPDFPAEIALVISNNSNALGLNYAYEAGIPHSVINHRDYESRADFDQALHGAITVAGANFICLAGFMRLLTTDFVEQWNGKIINIHPSLLPAFKGLNTHQRVIDAGETVSGCTVHYVTAELDAGPIIAQTSVPIIAGDTADTLAARVLVAEHELYPRAIQMIADGRASFKI